MFLVVPFYHHTHNTNGDHWYSVVASHIDYTNEGIVCMVIDPDYDQTQCIGRKPFYELVYTPYYYTVLKAVIHRASEYSLLVES